MATPSIPISILIIGSGVFGLSTAYSVAQNETFRDTKITLIDRSTFPAPDASSIDTSRIIRSDYADIAYARLGLEAQECWRHEWWGQDVYHESGLALLSNADGQEGEKEGGSHPGQSYMQKSLDNVRRLGLKTGSRADGGDVEVLQSRKDIASIFKQPDDSIGGGGGDLGYVNWRGGWADAEAGMRNLRKRVEATGRVHFQVAEVQRLLFSQDSKTGVDTVKGAITKSGEHIAADLTILAAGAWTPALIDLRGIASATGQTIAYLDLTAQEQHILEQNPTTLNESNGLFMIPPQNRILKVARHGYGYANPVRIPNPEPCSTQSPHESHITVSLPVTSHDDPTLTIPAEGLHALRAYLSATVPSLSTRPFTNTRICWYTDTALGDWIISHHPRYSGLFVATGGSGHAYKFLPVIGDKIVECILGRCPQDFVEKWAWPRRADGDQVWTDDWRGGEKGMVLSEEMEKGRSSRL